MSVFSSYKQDTDKLLTTKYHFDDKFKQRFWSKVCIGAPDDCWEWITCKDKYGYGRIAYTVSYKNKKVLTTHRVSWMLANGDIPEGMCICHTCDNPSCVNPNHLWLGTQKENVNDMVAKGRWTHPQTFGINQNKSDIPHSLRKECVLLNISGVSLDKLVIKLSKLGYTINRNAIWLWKSNYINDNTFYD